MAKIDIFNTNNKYNIIYSDPPWEYKTYSKKGQTKANGSMLPHYNTMSLDDIKSLPIKDICADECILFMWVTFPTIEQAFEVIKAWGFTYKTCAFCWVKQNPKSDGIYSGMGHWTNQNAELCLLATKKKFPKRVERNVKQIVLAHRENHSKKPDRVRNDIVRLVGDLPRVELFARQHADGWDCWGNEV
jgi:N6-adenosine-specific RNA methylase IME4